MKIALLIVDMQHIFLQDPNESPLHVGRACEYINYVANMMRAKDQVVVHIQDMEGAEGDTDPGVRDVIPDIPVEQSDIRVAKQYSNAFWQTELEDVLRNHGVGLVVVAGFAAEHCVTFTFNGARERGFQAVILQNGIVSSNYEAITAVYRDRPLVSYPVIQFMLK
jgi:nicotinamidase-related amidase